jgi:hypothetical protein
VHHVIECARKLLGQRGWQSEAIFSGVDGGQPKAAMFDWQAKKRAYRKAIQGNQEAKASSIGKMRVTEDQIDRARTQQFYGGYHVADKMASKSPLAQPVRQSQCILQILADQKDGPSGESHFYRLPIGDPSRVSDPSQHPKLPRKALLSKTVHIPIVESGCRYSNKIWPNFSQ